MKVHKQNFQDFFFTILTVSEVNVSNFWFNEVKYEI